MAAAAAARASWKWCEAAAPRSAAPAETSAPPCPAAPRPCASASSFALSSRRRPAAPRHPDTQFPLDGSATALNPHRCAGCAVSRDSDRATSEGRMRTPTGRPEAKPLRSFPPSLPREDVDGHRRDPGGRGRGDSQIGSSPLAAPLHPPRLPAEGRTSHFPGFSSASSAVKSRHTAAGGAGHRPPLLPG